MKTSLALLSSLLLVACSNSNAGFKSNGTKLQSSSLDRQLQNQVTSEEILTAILDMPIDEFWQQLTAQAESIEIDGYSLEKESSLDRFDELMMDRAASEFGSLREALQAAGLEQDDLIGEEPNVSESVEFIHEVFYGNSEWEAIRNVALNPEAFAGEGDESFELQGMALASDKAKAACKAINTATDIGLGATGNQWKDLLYCGASLASGALTTVGSAFAETATAGAATPVVVAAEEVAGSAILRYCTWEAAAMGTAVVSKVTATATCAATGND